MNARFFVIFTLGVITTAMIGLLMADVDESAPFSSDYSIVLASLPSVFKIDYVYGQASDLQMSSMSFSESYSDLPTGFGDTLSELDSLQDEIGDSLKEKIHPKNTQEPQNKVTIKEEAEQVGDAVNSEKGPQILASESTDSINEMKNVYVVDYNNIRIQKFNGDGDYVLKWGTKGKDDGQFGVPHGIDLDKDGNVYVVDMDNNNVQKFDSEGNFLLKWGSMGTDDGQFKKPAGLDIDDKDNVYVVDAGNSRIQKFSPDGEYMNTWGSKGSEKGQLASPHDIAVDSEGNSYVVEQDNFRVQKFSPDGEYMNTWGTQGSNNDQFLDPHSVVVGP